MEKQHSHLSQLHDYLQSQLHPTQTGLTPNQGPGVAESLLAIIGRLVELERRLAESQSYHELAPFGEIGRVVREARKRQELTIEDLADLADVGVSTIIKVENGKNQVQATSLIKVAQALGLDLLVGGR
ncbi:helix-turn-helix domain-containing protein [Saccharospirillum sp.]|uniref:helix-turn-helix domain-containing protein n=1 Tax=Saccharospirillum sp. TaxID=2033801 RepID=UPI0034A0AAB9